MEEMKASVLRMESKLDAMIEKYSDDSKKTAVDIAVLKVKTNRMGKIFGTVSAGAVGMFLWLIKGNLK